MNNTSPAARLIAVVLTAALIGASTVAEAQPRGSETAPVVSSRAAGPILMSARRAAAAEPLRDDSDGDGGRAAACDCHASMAEKLAWLYALVGGSIMLVTGPSEREGEVWTVDGKSETAAGAAAVVLSFYLLKDIRKKRVVSPAP